MVAGAPDRRLDQDQRDSGRSLGFDAGEVLDRARRVGRAKEGTCPIDDAPALHSIGTSAIGQMERLPAPGLSARCCLGKAMFARTRGNGEDAPLAVIGAAFAAGDNIMSERSAKAATRRTDSLD